MDKERSELISQIVDAIENVAEQLVRQNDKDNYWGGQVYEAKKELEKKLTALFEKIPARN
jgi:hypothetical protein